MMTNPTVLNQQGSAQEGSGFYLKNLRWYFRTYDDQAIRSVDLTKALAAAQGGIKFITMNAVQPVTDVSTNFK